MGGKGAKSPYFRSVSYECEYGFLRGGPRSVWTFFFGLPVGLNRTHRAVASRICLQLDTSAAVASEEHAFAGAWHSAASACTRPSCSCCTRQRSSRTSASSARPLASSTGAAPTIHSTTAPAARPAPGRGPRASQSLTRALLRGRLLVCSLAGCVGVGRCFLQPHQHRSLRVMRRAENPPGTSAWVAGCASTIHIHIFKYIVMFPSGVSTGARPWRWTERCCVVLSMHL